MFEPTGNNQQIRLHQIAIVPATITILPCLYLTFNLRSRGMMISFSSSHIELLPPFNLHQKSLLARYGAPSPLSLLQSKLSSTSTVHWNPKTICHPHSDFFVEPLGYTVSFLIVIESCLHRLRQVRNASQAPDSSGTATGILMKTNLAFHTISESFPSSCPCCQ